MIKPNNVGTNSQIKEKPAVAKKEPATAIKPAEKKPEAKPVELSKEAKSGEKADTKGLTDALAGNFGDDKKPKDAKEGEKDPKTGETKAKTPEEKKQVQQKIDKLNKELEEAKKKGDQEAIKRLTGEIANLQGQLGDPAGNKGGDNKGGTPPVDGGNNGGAAPAGGNNGGNQGGAAPAGGNQGGNQGGAAPAGGNQGGAAPAGGNQGAGGANEAGAGQGAGAGKEEVDQFIQFAAQSYGADPKVLSEIARRESNFNTGDVANNWDSNAKKGTPSKGMFQFIEPTFKSMMPQAKAANPGAWQGVSENWTDWKAQALTTAWAITHGKGSHWSTYQSAMNTARGGGTQNA
ncbi:hypothetical protein ABS71_12460 [bacterium SCN 62-11]|nr:transglycosylase SLT domain-containing protein [Candidatus Eremiobacteraeota bacterium]ODT65109.1 MAG: hypothetical protein ABS71_12460 [bacterium SCN 62-11]